jgi:hypothetical protein
MEDTTISLPPVLGLNLGAVTREHALTERPVAPPMPGLKTLTWEVGVSLKEEEGAGGSQILKCKC